MIWSDGTRYEGSYLEDKKHGFGTIIWRKFIIILLADSRSYSG